MVVVLCILLENYWNFASFGGTGVQFRNVWTHRRDAIEEYVVMECVYIIEVEYCMSKLVDVALGQRIVPTSLVLRAESVTPLDVLGSNSITMWKRRMLNNMLNLWSTFLRDSPLYSAPVDMMKLQGLLGKLTKIWGLTWMW
jgi:hypothetical protein